MNRSILAASAALLALIIPGKSQALGAKQTVAADKDRAMAKATIEQKLITEERRVVWEAVVKKDIKTLQDYFDDQFLDVSDVGIFSKSETIKLIPDLNIKDYSLNNFKVILPSKGTAIITYEAVQHWTIEGKEAPSHVRASSVWVNRNGRWRITFHQESTLNESISK
jgi:hypothetical protein